MRSSANIDAFLVLTISIASACFLLFSLTGINSIWISAAGILIGSAVFAAGIVLKKFAVIHLSLFYILLFGWIWSPLWPEYILTGLLAPSIAYLLVILVVPALRKTTTWFKFGTISRRVLFLSAAITAVSLSGLYIWALFSDNTIENYIYLFHPRIFVIELVIFALIFATINALTQEIIFRGVFLDALNATIGKGYYALFAQATIFGLIHYVGVPDDLAGIFMSFAYGFALGILRNLSGGLLLPVAIHFITDLFIFFMVFYKAGLQDMLDIFPLL